MYKTCPKCGYERQPDDDTPKEECPSCGLMFSKWIKSLAQDHELADAEEAQIAEQTWQKGLGSFFFHPRPGIAQGDLLILILIFLAFFAWGIDFIMMDFRNNAIGESWFHNVNLVFHEAGHVFFIPFGRYGSIMGGSIFQVIVPLVFMFSFLLTNRDAFGAAICLWWVGQSTMDIAPYIADARALKIPLTSGGTGADTPGMHDWANLLRPIGWLEYDIRIATVFDWVGSGILLLSMVWAATMLYIYYRDMLD